MMSQDKSSHLNHVLFANTKGSNSMNVDTMVDTINPHKTVYSYHALLEQVANHFSHASITSEHLGKVSEWLHPATLKSLIVDILKDEELLERIAHRSYTHALGFDKIVLMDLSRDVALHKENKAWKTQLRLHIWNPQKTGGLPIVESLHEHSFDFISTIITGHLENQQFNFDELSEEQHDLLNRFKAALASLDSHHRQWINGQIEIIEAIKLKTLGSEQMQKLNMLKDLNLGRVAQMTNLSHEDIWNLTALEGHYVSDRLAGEKKAYKHVLKDYVSITPHAVMQLDKGDYYYHPYTLPHRLYYDNKILNSTLLLTTPVADNPDGGSLQRPSYVEHSEQHYDKISFTVESFRRTLEEYLDYLTVNG
jgi:hypothetical protein